MAERRGAPAAAALCWLLAGAAYGAAEPPEEGTAATVNALYGAAGMLCSGNWEGVLRCDDRDGRRLIEERNHDGKLKGMSGDGASLLVTVGTDGRVVFRDTRSGQLRIVRLPARLNAVVWHAPGGQALVGDFDGRIYGVTPGGRITAYGAFHASAVKRLALSPDGQKLASVSWEGDLLVHSAADLAVEQAVRAGSGLNAAAFSPDGRYVAVGSLDGEVSLWPVAGMEAGPLASRRTATARLKSIAFHGGRWVVATLDGQVAVLSHPDLYLLGIRRLAQGSLLALWPEGDAVYAGGDKGRIYRITLGGGAGEGIASTEQLAPRRWWHAVASALLRFDFRWGG